MLKRLHELGADLVEAYDVEGRSPLDYAVYYCHKDASEFLRELHAGKPTRFEQRRLAGAATKLQALTRGKTARREVALMMAAANGISPLKKPKTKTAAQEAAFGAHM